MTTTTNNLFTTTALPSIRNRALLVSVTFTKPPMTKLDRKATHDAESANNAYGAIKAQKMLYPKHLIDPIVSKENEVRNYLKSKTVEWGTTGLYLLDSSLFMEVADKLSTYQLERQQLVTVFANNWSNVMSQAQSQQGALFDPSVYPDVSNVVQQFTTTINYLPVGDISHGLFDTVEAEIQQAIAQKVEETTRNLVRTALQQPLERLIDIVMNIHDKTSRDDSRLSESVYESLTALLDLMPALNVLDNPQLNQLAQTCRDKLTTTSIDALRDKKSESRARVARETKEILSSVGIDPASTQRLTQTERKEAATTAAQNILAKMRGFN